jgi:hypothetical protein
MHVFFQRYLVDFDSRPGLYFLDVYDFFVDLSGGFKDYRFYDWMREHFGVCFVLTVDAPVAIWCWSS